MPTLAYLTLDSIRELPAPPSGNTVFWAHGVLVQGREVPKGFGVRVTANGARSFVLNYSLNGKEHRYTIGSTATWNVTEAVREARQLRQRIDRGEDPMAKAPAVEAKKTVEEILDLFLNRARLKRPDHYTDAFERLVKPALGQLPINELRRRHIVELLDKIEDENGPVMATRALSYLRSACNWHAVRDDSFVPPFVRGMARSSTADRARDRILTDDELRTLWPVFESNGNLGRACQVMLLTSSRRSEVTGMPWAELVDGGTWIIPPSRYKTKREHVLPLSPAALAIVEAQPRTGPLVFPGRQGAVLSRGGQGKARIDRATPGLAHWTLHDLRRTARSLMSRAGVRPDVAERVLGHAIPGVAGTYDRFHYLEEKREALKLLAETVRGIVDQESAVDKKCNM
jgi:integrase